MRQGLHLNFRALEATIHILQNLNGWALRPFIPFAGMTQRCTATTLGQGKPSFFHFHMGNKIAYVKTLNPEFYD
jgi:hypothetical protein